MSAPTDHTPRRANPAWMDALDNTLMVLSPEFWILLLLISLPVFVLWPLSLPGSVWLLVYKAKRGSGITLPVVCLVLALLGALSTVLVALALFGG